MPPQAKPLTRLARRDPQSHGILATIGAEEPGVSSATLKLWEVEQLVSGAAPAALKSAKVFSSKLPESQVTALAVAGSSASGLLVAVGLGSGNVYLFKADLATGGWMGMGGAVGQRRAPSPLQPRSASAAVPSAASPKGRDAIAERRRGARRLLAHAGRAPAACPAQRGEVPQPLAHRGRWIAGAEGMPCTCPAPRSQGQGGAQRQDQRAARPGRPLGHHRPALPRWLGPAAAAAAAAASASAAAGRRQRH
jgi:hypothetical protein